MVIDKKTILPSKYTLKVNKGRPIADINSISEPKDKNKDFIGLRAIPLVGGKSKPKFKNYDDRNDSETINKSIEMTDDGNFYLTPAIDPTLPERNQRNVYFIAGPSGSGKSTLSADIIMSYKKNFPKNSVILFTKIGTPDPAFEGINDMLKVELNSEFAEIQDTVGKEDEHEDVLKISDFKDSLVIFDDVDRITNKSIKKAAISLRNEIFEMGRHYNTFMICTSHQIMNYQETKIALMESTHIAIFPGMGADRQIENFLKTYGGMKKPAIEKIMNLPTRWALFSKHAPQYILYQLGVYLL